MVHKIDVSTVYSGYYFPQQTFFSCGLDKRTIFECYQGFENILSVSVSVNIKKGCKSHQQP